MSDEKRTLGQELVGLSAEERARRYREFAGEAIGRAEATPDANLRAEYYSLATAWHAMASELERNRDYDGILPGTASGQLGRNTQQKGGGSVR